MNSKLVGALIFCLGVQSGYARIGLPKLDWSQVGKGRIVGGEEAADGEFPWQVSLRQIGAIGATHFCGGSIIDENWIMTAAHCCAGQTPAFMHVVAGGIKLNAAEGEEEKRDLEMIIGHPDYDSRELTNDICLLKMKEPLEWTEFVQPAALPEPLAEVDGGVMATVTGWGTTSVILFIYNLYFLYCSYFMIRFFHSVLCM